jgi:trigger factor
MPEDDAVAQEEQTDQESDQGTEEKTEQDKLKEVIEVSTEDVGTLRKKLTITIPREKIDENLSTQFGDLSRDASVPGFRKGRAPKRLIEKRFGSEVSDQVVSQFLGSGYMAAIDKEDLKVIGDPLIWVQVKNEDAKDAEALVDRLVPVDKALEVIHLPDEGAFTFSCEIELHPTFELPELDGIPVEKPKVEVGDDDVDAEVKRLLSHRGTYEPVADLIQEDDLVVADLKMTADDLVLKDESNIQFAARPQRVEGVALETLGDMLSGKKPGDEVSAEGELPEDYEKVELRGKTAKFVFKINDVKRLVLPELTDEWLKGVGFESEKEFKDFIRGELESRVGDIVTRGMRGQVYKYLLDKTAIDLPEGLSQRQVDRAIMRKMVDLYRQGVPQAEIEKHIDELRVGAQKEAMTDLKSQFIMEKIAKELEIKIGEDEINGQIAAIARRQGRRFDRVRDELSKQDGLGTLYFQLRDERIIDQLLEKAVVTETEGPSKASDKKKPDKASKAKSSKKKKKAKRSKSTPQDETDEPADGT